MSRFSVTYRIATTDPADARARAEGIAREQTVEAPPEACPPEVERVFVGRIEALDAAGPAFLARISFPVEAAGPDFNQFVNVVFGNSSMQPGLRVEAIDAGPMRQVHRGPRFGTAGVRALCGRPAGGLIVPVLKPMGLSAAEIADLAGICAAGGADIVKEDHGLGDQPMAPFRERVARTAEAVARANASTGGRCLYFPALAGADLDANLRFAKDAGADGVLIMPGLLGFGTIARVAADAALRLPVMAHPAFLGGWTASPDHGFAHHVLHGTLMRLAGADLSIFPNTGGRFGWPAETCRAIADACRDPDGPGIPILPSPGGGMSVARAGDMAQMYGADVAYLLGGSLMADRAGIPAALGQMRAALDAHGA